MGKITDKVRCWARYFFPDRSLGRKGIKITRYESVSLFAAALVPGDKVEVRGAASVLNDHDLVPGSLHLVARVEVVKDSERGRSSDAHVVSLVSGKSVLACWLVPEISRKK